MKEELSLLTRGRLKNSAEFGRRFRSLEIGVINDTSIELEFNEEFFDSGTWFDHFDPLVIKPHKAVVGYVANRQGKPTGVTGGLKFEIRGKRKYLILGFNNPVLGSYKTSITVTTDSKLGAKDGYLRSRDDSTKKKLEEGYILQATLHEAREDGKKLAVYKISEASD